MPGLRVAVAWAGLTRSPHGHSSPTQREPVPWFRWSRCVTVGKCRRAARPSPSRQPRGCGCPGRQALPCGRNSDREDRGNPPPPYPPSVPSTGETVALVEFPPKGRPQRARDGRARPLRVAGSSPRRRGEVGSMVRVSQLMGLRASGERVAGRCLGGRPGLGGARLSPAGSPPREGGLGPRSQARHHAELGRHAGGRRDLELRAPCHPAADAGGRG